MALSSIFVWVWILRLAAAPDSFFSIICDEPPKVVSSLSPWATPLVKKKGGDFSWENSHRRQKWRFSGSDSRWVSVSIGWFSGFMLVLRGAIILDFGWQRSLDKMSRIDKRHSQTFKLESDMSQAALWGIYFLKDFGVTFWLPILSLRCQFPSNLKVAEQYVCSKVLQPLDPINFHGFSHGGRWQRHLATKKAW